MDHQYFMHRCLELAEKGRGFVGTNPLVGSVLVREEKIITEGWHSAFGEDHAERMLIKKLDQTIPQESGLYVNLEPCCHHGKTPPCTSLIIESGIKNVVYGMLDPNPEVAGQGIEKLRAAGINVVGPVIPEVCKRLNKGFVSLQGQGRPYITLKKAQLLDGSVSNSNGLTVKITSEEQNEWSHTFLRATHDAIMVGVQTVIVDNPLLTARYSNKKFDQEKRNTYRLILDPEFRIPMNAKIVSGDFVGGTIIIVGTNASQEKEEELMNRGVRILRIPLRDGIFDWDILWAMLTTSDENFFGITSVLVEGGAKTWQHFKDAGQYDEEVILVGDSSK